jgi:hypothetical protein
LAVENKQCSHNNCAICCQILWWYSLLTDAYSLHGLAYKFLTLSITQVVCERSFSTFRFVKNKLRSSMSQENLNSFITVCTKKNSLINLVSVVIVDKVSEISQLLQNWFLQFFCRSVIIRVIKTMYSFIFINTGKVFKYM